MMLSASYSPVLSSIAFASESWAWVAVGFGVASLLILFFSYRNSPLRGAPRIFALLFKAIGLILLALVLLEPVRLDEQPKKNANDLVIAADNSSGMTIALQEENPTPADLLADALGKENPDSYPEWMDNMQDTFRLQTFLFDRNLRRSATFADLDFETPYSDLETVLTGIETRFKDRPHAATLLLTDGNATDSAKIESWLEAIETENEERPPIYPVLIGEENPEATDLAITEVDASLTQFEDARVSLSIETSARGVFPNPVEVFVLNEKGEELAKKQIAFSPEAAPQKVPVRLRLAAIPPGISFLTAGIRQIGDETIPELTEKNNQFQITVNQGSGPYRILYVSGRPNWEYKFLRRALAEDAELDLVGLIRIAKREPKFEWRGRTGESSNPLFRGFNSDIPEETQKYDEPVLIRLNTATPEELRDGFPSSEEELFPHYRAIVLDDIESEFFTQEQQELVDRFVSLRGGTLVMLGGQESFQSGEWQNTAIGRLLPVYLERLGSGPPAIQGAYNLTREGWLEPWMRLRANQNDETTRLAYMTPFFAINQIRAIKPGARLLATVKDSEDRLLPAIVTQRYGEGRSAAVPVGDFWRWGMKDAEQQAELGKSWRQLLRWSVNEVATRVNLQKEELNEGGLPLTEISVRVRDETFRAQDDATVMLTVTGQDGSSTVLSGEPSLDEPGLFTAQYSTIDPVGYRITATVLDGDGEEIGSAETARAVNPEARELASLGPNRDLLQRIADVTGGKLLTLEDLDRLPALLEDLDLPVSEMRQTPLWHAPWLFLLALAFFLGEWIIRRRQGIL
ncbi:MAG: hypothetical protein P1U85_03160 [Verrucomicrobiales bacterium]|nr:hypothetical protein [Verrucomicrobiales bacterium]